MSLSEDSVVKQVVRASTSEVPLLSPWSCRRLDDQLEQHEFGWRVFFRTLRLVLTHFRDQPSASLQLTAAMSPPKEEAWAKLTSAVGIDSHAVGSSVRAREPAPRLSGRVEHAGEGDYREDLLLRIDEPAPGLAHLFAMPMGGQIILPIRFYLFGEQAAEVASRAEATWRNWLERLNK